eukprot:Skav213355  [mRNA]  locus=scaffold317:125828:138563:- [translate_table: standard]
MTSHFAGIGMCLEATLGAEELKWSTVESCREFFIEMVLDRSTPSATKTTDLKPAKDATVKRVNMGRDTSGSIQNMPEGRNFLVRVIGKLQVGKEIYSPWTRAITLSPKTRDKDLGNLDPMNMPRMNCNNCPCACYVPFRWGLNSPGRLRCRRCGCHHTEHQCLGTSSLVPGFGRQDFNFMMQLQLRRGERCVHLVPDDFGMCLHVQHGGRAGLCLTDFKEQHHDL